MVKLSESICAWLVPALAGAEPVASFSMGRTAQGLFPDVAYTVRMVALNGVGLVAGRLLRPTTRATGTSLQFERPSTFQSSLHSSCLERGCCDLWATMHSSGIVATCGRASRRLR